MRYLFAAIFIFLFPMTASSSSQDDSTVTLRTPPSIPHGFYIRDVLSLVYSNIGYKVNFVSLPAMRELILAKNKQISGVLAKDIVVKDTFPSLVRVEHPLLEYKVLYVADRRECGYCLLDSVEVIGFPRGGQVFPMLLKKFFPNADSTALSWNLNVEDVVAKGRLPAFITTDIGLSENIDSNPHMIVHELDRRYDFHYLAPHMAHLKDKVNYEFVRLESEGVLDELRARYGLMEPKRGKIALEDKPVKAVSGNWWEYTEVDGSGVYWDLVKHALYRRAEVVTEATTWPRAVRMFEAKKADMLVGAYKHLPKGYLSSKYHIDYESEVLVLGKSTDILARFEEGDMNLTVCVAETYELVEQVASKRAFIHQTDFNKCEELFFADRVDLIVDYPYNLEHLLKQYPNKQFYESLPLHVLFHDTEDGRLLKEQFDQGMERAAKKGELAQYFINLDDFVFARITEMPTN